MGILRQEITFNDTKNICATMRPLIPLEHDFPDSLSIGKSSAITTNGKQQAHMLLSLIHYLTNGIRASRGAAPSPCLNGIGISGEIEI